MMQALDQWAFQFLIMAFNFIGVSEVPQVADTDWKVVSSWEDIGDHTYRLEIKNNEVTRECALNPEKKIVFPQTYLSRQEIFIDNYLVYTNKRSGDWNLNTTFDRPVLSCRYFSVGSTVTMVTVAYLNFFRGISHYPYISKNSKENFLYNQIYLVAAAICISLGIIAAILLGKMGSNENITTILLRDGLIAVFLLTYASGYVVDIHLKYINVIMGITIVESMLFIIRPLFSLTRNNKIFIGATITQIILFLMFISYKHAVAIFVMFFVSLFILFLMFAIINIVRNRSEDYLKISFAQKITYIIILALAVQDFYIAYISRVGYFHLGVLCIVISIVSFIEVVKKAQETVIENINNRQKLEKEKMLVENLSKLHDLHREIIHDIKSPITAFEFLTNKIDNDSMKNISKRFKEIIGKYEQGSVRASSDWYSVEQIKLCIKFVIDEKQMFFNKVDLEFIDTDVDVFFDPVEIKIVFAELIDNSWKSKNKSLNISVSGRKTEQGYTLVYKDDAGGMSADMLSKIGKKGFSKAGTGLGIFSITKKINSYGGSIEFENEGNGIRIVMIFKMRLLGSSIF